MPRPGAPRQGGRVRACITRYQSHHLIWEAGLLHPSCTGRSREQDWFSQPEPLRAGLDPAAELPLCPLEPEFHGVTHHPDSDKANRGLSKTQPWFPMAEAGSVQRFDPPPSPLKIKAVH